MRKAALAAVAPQTVSTSLTATLHTLPAAAWQVYPDAESIHYLPLVTVGGLLTHTFSSVGAVAATTWLTQSPALQHALSAFCQPISRSYLLRLPAHSRLSLPVTHNYHHWQRHHLYLPLQTVKLQHDATCNALAAYRIYRLPSLAAHELRNDSDQAVVLLVATSLTAEPTHEIPATLNLETYQFEIFTPTEFQQLCQPLLNYLRTFPDSTDSIEMLDRLQQAWHDTFQRFGRCVQGELWYRDILLDLTELMAKPLQQTEWAISQTVQQCVSILTSVLLQPAAKQAINRFVLTRRRQQHQLPESLERLPKFDRPLFIVSAPRAGSTLLFDLLAKYPDVWTIAEESHEAIEGIAGLHPAERDFHSNCLTADDATAARSLQLKQRFTMRLQDRDAQRYLDLPPETQPSQIRFLEKTPKNALRIAFLKAIFPDARFIFLYREPKENVSSLIEGWYSRRFLAYKTLSRWPHREWSFLLPPNWREYENAGIAEIAAYQWRQSNQLILEALETLPAHQWCKVNYTELIANPHAVLQRLGTFAALHADTQLQQYLQAPPPPSRMTLSLPAPDKWKRHYAELSPLLADLQTVWSRLESDAIC